MSGDAAENAGVSGEGEGALVLEVEGTSSRMLFVEGRPLPPFAVGKAGPLAMEGGSDLLDAHVFLHFDGQALLACSTSAEKPAFMDGAPLPRQWTRLNAPCKLSMGSISLAFRRQMPELARDGAALPRAAPLRRSSGRFMMPCVALGLVVAAVAAGRFFSFPDAPSGPAPTAQTPPPAVSAAADEGGAGAPITSAIVVHPAPPNRPAHPVGGATSGRRDAGPAPRSLEREAVDALKAGDRERALTIYRQLTVARPDHPAFAQAARIIAANAVP